MTEWRNIVGISLSLVSFFGLAGCSPEAVWSPSATAPDPNTQRPPVVLPEGPRPFQLATFTDSVSGVSTSDVRDVHDEVLQFNLGSDELIWSATGIKFSEFIVDGDSIGYHHKQDWIFQIRFGTRAGERRAFLARPDKILQGAPPTILDLWVDEHGDLKFVETSVVVPPA